MITWCGTVGEYARLAASVQTHCICDVDEQGELVNKCPAHAMIDSDQKAMDHLVFVYRLRERFLKEEQEGETDESATD